jgi:hypothetical protein
MTTTLDYWRTVAEMGDQFPTMRPGQIAFIALDKLDPKLSSLVCGTMADPYHAPSWDDPVFERFQAFIKRHFA